MRFSYRLFLLRKQDEAVSLPYTIPAMALFRRKFRLTACATTGG
jgi:hypothetical protein